MKSAADLAEQLERALAHALHRNHPHSDECAGCKEAKETLAMLAVREPTARQRCDEAQAAMDAFAEIWPKEVK